MTTKIIINNVDFSEMIGDPVYIGEKCYIPIDFLKSFFKAELKVSQLDKKIEINIDPKKIIEDLTKTTKSENVFGIKVEKGPDGQPKVKGELSIGEMFNVSTDAKGNYQAGLSFKW